MGHSNFILVFLIFFILKEVSGATFTFVNKCSYTIWPGILGTPALETTGFELGKGNSRSFQAPAGWSGRFWGRTGCTFDGSGHGSCATADCGSGEIQCNGSGANPPATLTEFTLGSGSGAQDFYDVSLVDGYNLQMIVEASGGSGDCLTTGCVDDLNRRCPSELRVGSGGACRSACDAFGTPEYCCKGAFGSPVACKPTAYSQLFKSACPRSYSYAYDDATSTFTCTAADYTVTFCPSPPSQKAGKEANRNEETGSGSGPLLALLTNSSLYVDLASGDPTTLRHPLFQMIALFISVIFISHTFLIF